MIDKEEPAPAAATPPPRRDPGRERLAAALRENLHRRKQQARARRAGPETTDACRTTDTDVENR